MRTVKINGVEMSHEAAENVEQVGIDPAIDVALLRNGVETREALLARCLEGVEEEKVADDWRDYVEWIAVAAAKPADEGGAS